MSGGNDDIIAPANSARRRIAPGIDRHHSRTDPLHHTSQVWDKLCNVLVLSGIASIEASGIF
jgi:hypothetical protein